MADSLLKKFSAGFFAVLFILCLVFAQAPGFSADDMSVEEVSKTSAAKLYEAKKYTRALEEFQKLEKEHPGNILIKRYMASIYDALRQWDMAEQKLQEALSLRTEDPVSRQMLGDLYMKRAEFGKAGEQYRTLLEKNPSASNADYAQKKLTEIESLKAMPGTQAGSQMAPQDFIKTGAAQEFSKGNYVAALEGFDRLRQEYPEDLLVQRFRGMALLKLGRKEEAVSAFREALQNAPDNAALHFYLGQAYEEIRKGDEARREYQWVASHDVAGYRYRAQQELSQSGATRGSSRSSQKPWTIYAAQGWEYDTNASYRSRDPGFRTADDQNSNRFNTVLSGSYKFYQKGKWFFTADTLYSQSLYDDLPRLNTYTPGGGISALYAFNFLGKPTFFNIREGMTDTFLKSKYFLFTNSVTPSLIFNFHPRLRTTVSHRWAVNAYHNDGVNPDATSRDGFVNNTSLANTWYFNDVRTRYATLTYDYERNDTEGVDYVKNAHGIRTDLHSPLFEKLEGDFTFRFRDSNFPQYVSGPPKRRDDLFSFTVSVSRPLTSYLILSLSYTFEQVEGANNLYEYDKNVFGSQLTLRY